MDAIAVEVEEEEEVKVAAAFVETNTDKPTIRIECGLQLMVSSGFQKLRVLSCKQDFKQSCVYMEYVCLSEITSWLRGLAVRKPVQTFTILSRGPPDRPQEVARHHRKSVTPQTRLT